MGKSKSRNCDRWSYSRASTFSNCKYEYYLKYIINDDEIYLSENNFYAEAGSFMHLVLAKIFLNELTVDNAIDYFIENYDDNVFYQVRQSTMDKSYYKMLDYLANVDFSWLDDYEIVSVEKEINFHLLNYNFVGFIDLLLKDKRDGEFVIVDHKSVEYPYKANTNIPKKNSIKHFETYTRQMYLYAHAVKEIFGKYPKKMIWNHFKDGGKLAELNYNSDAYQKSMQWFIDIIKMAEKEKNYLPTQEYFYCNNLCNFRNSCDYNMFEEVD